MRIFSSRAAFGAARCPTRSAVLMLVGVFGVLALANEAAAQNYSYSATNMWGTAPSGVAVPGALESAVAHAQNSTTAGAVNGAAAGLLLGTGGDGGAISSIGSQTIVSNTVFGNNNPTTISASQSATNSGNVSNAGQIGESNTHNGNN
jgi:hypothetical protein